MKCLLDSDLCSIQLSLFFLFFYISSKACRDLAKGIMRHIGMVIIIILMSFLIFYF